LNFILHIGLKNELANLLNEQQATPLEPVLPTPHTTVFKLPDDFEQKMDELRKLKTALEDLRNSFNNVSNY
jgi:uncharacterized protein YdeI (YjbR/CyaY-like superfamily)